MTRPPKSPYARHTSRVLLVNDENRVLLFKFHRTHPAPGVNAHCWLTPGGGIDRGESVVDAAVRELAEETGLKVTSAELGPLIAFTGGYADLGWKKGEFREDFFFLRVAAHDVDTSGFEAHEIASMSEFHWWSIEELAASEDDVYPYDLVPLLTDLFAGRVPAEPRSLTWHH